jgi:hypothetical protein
MALMQVSFEEMGRRFGKKLRGFDASTSGSTGNST